MRTATALLLMLPIMALAISAAYAHGDAPHPKCKKGYVVSDDHRCVKAK